MNRKLILVLALAAIPVVALAPPASPRANGHTLRGRRGNRTVVRISVMIAGNKTAQGIGVGTTERRLRRAYRGRLRCRSYENPNSTYGWIHECLLGRRTERHTLFFMSGEQIIVNRPPLPSRVIRIVVTEPGRFTEFGAGHPET